MLTVKARATAMVGIKNTQQRQTERKRETDTRSSDHPVFKVLLNKKHRLTKQTTTKQKHANPLIGREAIYNHLIILSAFLCSCTLSDWSRLFCLVNFFLPYKWHFRKHTATPTRMSTRWGGRKNTPTHGVADFSTLFKYLWVHLCEFLCHQVVIQPIISNQQVLSP